MPVAFGSWKTLVNPNVTCAIIVPSYNETLALPEMLLKLEVGLTAADAVIIMDDSPERIAAEVNFACSQVFKESSASYFFINHQGKSGRGSAVRRGMDQARAMFPSLKFVIECDADGSHRPIDILRVKHSEIEADLLVGSRYLPDSKIQGWPISRKLFSRALNFIIPRLLHVELGDITNGLRRYSIDAVNEIIGQNQANRGFIYLSEQALVVKKRGLSIKELPIVFMDRTQGSSTVTWHEVVASIRGVIGLVTLKAKD